MNDWNSRCIADAQREVNENLHTVVNKHRTTTFLKPIQPHNRVAFERIQQKIQEHDKQRLILDSCCGTGLSSMKLAAMNPDAFVIGIDQSMVRLSKSTEADLDNLHYERANCEDVWRLLMSAGVCFDEHYILYPNPYPKPAHLKRRWHGHPVFPTLIGLSKKLTLRSNWRLYLEEFNLAWHLMEQPMGVIDQLKIVEPLTLFERKYWHSAQALYELQLT